MLTARIEEREKYIRLLGQRLLRSAFEALSRLGNDSPLGIASLDMEGAYVDVHTYETRTEMECVWESHAHTIDLQYVIEGSECIDYAPVDMLDIPKSYIPEKDRYEYEADIVASRIHLPAGRWAIFFPGDAHKPMIRTSENGSVLKAVVKIEESRVTKTSK